MTPEERPVTDPLSAIGLKPGDLAGDPYGDRKARRVAKTARVSRQAVPDAPEVAVHVFVNSLQSRESMTKFTVCLSEGEVARMVVGMPDGRIGVYGDRDGVGAGEPLWWTASDGRYAVVQILRPRPVES